ncbi:MAG: hypothetical protein [Circular genetic element sp.]|nr:MAG: hypothetical protein [Circular genetic element sp.]
MQKPIKRIVLQSLPKNLHIVSAIPAGRSGLNDSTYDPGNCMARSGSSGEAEHPASPVAKVATCRLELYSLRLHLLRVLAMKCTECRTKYHHLGFGWWIHPVETKFSMPMDGYLPEHWEKTVCSQSGNSVKST